MKTKRLWLMAAVLVGIAVLEVRSQRAQVSDLRGELTRMRDQQDRLALQAARPPRMVQVQATAAPGSTENPRPEPVIVRAAPSQPAEGDPAAANRGWEDEARSVEEAFAAEPVDGAWAAQARSIVQNRLGAVSRGLSSALGAVDCHASICRVEISHRNAEAARRFAEQAFVGSGEPAWDGPVMVAPPEVHADGSLVAIMYLGRRDTSLVKRAH